MLSEFSSVIKRERIRQFLSKPPEFYLEEISEILNFYDIEKRFVGSPDIHDDYLIDIILQTNAIGLVTGDKALLAWKEPAIQIVSWLDFQMTYPL